MKAHIVTLTIVDHDDVGEDEIRIVIENTHYANRCIDPRVAAVETFDIGEWADDHPLNVSGVDELAWLYRGADSIQKLRSTLADAREIAREVFGDGVPDNATASDIAAAFATLAGERETFRRERDELRADILRADLEATQRELAAVNYERLEALRAFEQAARDAGSERIEANNHLVRAFDAERERDNLCQWQAEARVLIAALRTERDDLQTLLGATRAQLAEVENREAARRAAFFTPFAKMPDESRPFLDQAIKRIGELEEALREQTSRTAAVVADGTHRVASLTETLKKSRAAWDDENGRAETWKAKAAQAIMGRNVAEQERDAALKQDADARSCLNTVVENGRATVDALRLAEHERDTAKDERDRALQAKLRAEQERDQCSAEFANAYWLCKADRARLIPDTLSGVADVYGRPVAEYIRRSAGPDYDNGRVNRATAICVAIQALPVAERFPVVGRFQMLGALADALPVASDEAEAALARLDAARESRPIVDESEAAAAYLEREAVDVETTYGQYDPVAKALRLRAKRIREGAHRERARE